MPSECLHFKLIVLNAAACDIEELSKLLSKRRVEISVALDIVEKQIGRDGELMLQVPFRGDRLATRQTFTHRVILFDGGGALCRAQAVLGFEILDDSLDRVLGVVDKFLLDAVDRFNQLALREVRRWLLILTGAGHGPLEPDLCVLLHEGVEDFEETHGALGAHAEVLRLEVKSASALPRLNSNLNQAHVVLVIEDRLNNLLKIAQLDTRESKVALDSRHVVYLLATVVKIARRRLDSLPFAAIVALCQLLNF